MESTLKGSLVEQSRAQEAGLRNEALTLARELGMELQLAQRVLAHAQALLHFVMTN
jgi:hypothetical protein